jgi:peptide/nickel transport system substrate-binding protein
MKLRAGNLRFAALALGLFAMIGVRGAGAADQPRSGGTITVADPVGPPVLDPHKDGSYQSSGMVLTLFYEGLLRRDEQGRLQPQLAEAWTAVSPTVYEFKLRRGVTFHNGREMNASDVKYSFERVLDPKTGSPFRALWAAIERLETPDASTVRFHLRQPSAPFLNYLAGPYAYQIVPKEAVEQHGDLNQTAVGTGPFKLVEYVPDSHLKLERHSTYWRKGLPRLDGMTIRIIKDESARLSAIRAGAADVTYVTAANAPLVKQDRNLRLLEGDNVHFGMTLAQFIPNDSKEPFTDKRVRQAMSLAIDRKEIVDTAVFGSGVVSGPIPPAMRPWAIPVSYVVDLDKAKALLREAGHPKGFKATAKVSPQYPLDVANCQIIKSQLQRIGIELEIQLVEWGQFLKEWLGGNYDTVCLTSGPLAEPDAFTYDYFHSKSPRNRAKFFTGELDDLVTQARGATEPEKRRELLAEVQRAVLDLAPVIYLYSGNGFEVHRPHVKGYQANRLSRYGFAEAWVEK